MTTCVESLFATRSHAAWRYEPMWTIMENSIDCEYVREMWISNDSWRIEDLHRPLLIKDIIIDDIHAKMDRPI